MCTFPVNKAQIVVLVKPHASSEFVQPKPQPQMLLYEEFDRYINIQNMAAFFHNISAVENQ